MKDLQVIHVHVKDVCIVPGRNPRLELENIEELAESIQENGVRNPIKVRPNTHNSEHKYELVDGHRRLAACKYLQDTVEENIDIPAMVVEHYKNEVDILVEMMVSNDSLPFAPFEEALLYARLRDEFKLSNEQIAKRVGKSMSHVSDKLALLRADEAVKKAVKEKIISPSDANTVVRKSSGSLAKQQEIIERIQTEGKEAVIEHELKKGRMSRPLWALAEQAYDEVWSNAMNLDREKCMKVLEVNNIRDWFELTFREDANLLRFVFGLGQLEVFKNASHLNLKELWEKLETRITGK